MSVTDADGNTLSETALNALCDPAPTPPAMVVVGADVLQRYSIEGASGPKAFERQTRLLFHEGQIVKQTEIDALFADATIDTITPATGPAAGGTAVTIKGSNFAGVSGVTIGGVACTQVRVVSETTITAVTGAHAAGAVNVVVADDSGNVTKTSAFTYS